MTHDILVEELRRDIWRPFVDIYATHDTARFADLHARDLMRAEGASGWSGGFDGYVARVGAFFDDMTAKGAALSIAFRFAEHIVSAEVASQRGIYRIDLAIPGDAPLTVYGRFHAFARKRDGRWRIAVDYDTDKDVGEQDFLAARA